MTIPVRMFQISSSTGTVLLNYPSEIEIDNGRDIKVLNFESDRNTVFDTIKTAEKLRLTGVYNFIPLSEVTSTFCALTTQNSFNSIYKNNFRGRGFAIPGPSNLKNDGCKVHDISIYGLRQGTVSKVTVFLFEDIATCGYGQSLASATVNGSIFDTTNYNWITFTLDSNPTLIFDKNYVIILASNGPNSSNRIKFGLSSTPSYTRGGSWYWDGTTWYDVFEYGYCFRVNGFKQNVFEIIDQNIVGKVVTLSGFRNDDFDTQWLIADFQYRVEKGDVEYGYWSLDLEKKS